MNNLKPCPCGQTPTELCIEQGSTYRWRYVSGGCCGFWNIEVKVNYGWLYAKNLGANDEEEVKKICTSAWNNAPRATDKLEKAK